MPQSDYERILGSLNVTRNHVKHVNIAKAVRVTDYKNIDNKLIVVNKGKISWDEGTKVVTVQEGEMCFLPELSTISVTYGVNQPVTIDNNQFTNYQEQYFKVIHSRQELAEMHGSLSSSFSYISFNAKVYEAIDFFKFVDIPAFKIGKHTALHAIFQNIMSEAEQSRLGKDEVLKNLSKGLVIELIRYIIENNYFIERFVMKGAALTDLRLSTLFKYITNNLSGDLTNKALADAVDLSKDYVGQYFKNHTGMKLQDHVEMMRLNVAVELLKSNPTMRIKDVAKACGFSDLAYFCRKFKHQWGTPARTMRTALVSRNR